MINNTNTNLGNTKLLQLLVLVAIYACLLLSKSLAREIYIYMVITTEYTFILKRFDDCLSQLTYFTCLSIIFTN